jgi:FkbM family methyltransferase
MKIIDQIMRSEYFRDQPPVLIDIGASGGLHSKWKYIAKYAYCVAFDADEREFQISEEINKDYKKLIHINRIVTALPSGNANFYLTYSPFCSSLLEPDEEKLSPWLFKPLFEVKKITSLPAVTLTETLRSASISYVDWFKVDTQGTDLRIYKSLSEEIRKTILLAEFEPGIMDAYKDEDKLYSVMQEMHSQGFWLSTMNVKGTQRLQYSYSAQIGDFLSERIIRTSPGWAELTYFRNPENLSCRSLLLMTVFALLERQYGFALELADKGRQQFRDPLLDECRKAVLNKIQREKKKIPLILLKRKINKLFASIHA